ncbi:Ankyrin repeats (3 copies) [Phytophthora infestans]|uniref:Ankyrin repeats (3 copies) n=1 Tax=Phytophthora infestans TaxID=4787 RepID=A0A833SUV3_PHYIN|nr:Ankyrin repeats (3 copies) [Phytophthora infestans]
MRMTRRHERYVAQREEQIESAPGGDGDTCPMIVIVELPAKEKLGVQLVPSKNGVIDHVKGVKALMLSSLFGRVRAVKGRIDSGADVNLNDKRGKTAEMVAAGKAQTNIVSVLLDNGADIYAKSYDGKTALMLASCLGHTATEARLLKSGAADTVDSQGWTPLIGAAKGGHVRVMRLLLEKDSHDINIVENSALLYASFVDAAWLLLKYKVSEDKQNRFDKAKRTPLIRVAFNGEEECVRLLLENVYLFDPQGAEQQILQDKTIEDDKKSFWHEARIWKRRSTQTPFHSSAPIFVGRTISLLARKLLNEACFFFTSANIIHSDLKCNQILVGENGEAMLTD